MVGLDRLDVVNPETDLSPDEGLTVIEDSLIWKLREWSEWTGRMRMSAEARRDLEDFVRRAPERCRAAFEFRLAEDTVVSFNDRQILIRADRD